jgi:hypothetical protein
MFFDVSFRLFKRIDDVLFLVGSIGKLQLVKAVAEIPNIADACHTRLGFEPAARSEDILEQFPEKSRVLTTRCGFKATLGCVHTFFTEQRLIKGFAEAR